MVSSTPGGIEMGVRPSLDCCAVDAENVLRAVGPFASAGTRKDGSVIMDEEQTAALDLLETSMAGACGGIDFNSQSHSSTSKVAEIEFKSKLMIT